MVEPIFDYQFRLILIGDSTVGKSSLLKYFTEGRYEENCDPTVGVDFFARLLEVNPGLKVKLQVWDTAGQERFRSITKSYYRNSVGVLLIYDITKRSTFDHIGDWLNEVRVHIEPQRAIYMIVGHKADQEDKRQVGVREARQFAEYHGFRHIETSAVTGQNIEETFVILARDIYKMLQDGRVYLDDGWDGIKQGYIHPKGSVNLEG
ncbi:hypothetical protein HELRODRAFT_185418, partial [Helobdella robusta]|uniref:Ras-related protein Rab-39B n=1 Tax=Helobdella robusta TaxID=6412 RepID=T1FMS8_HELRO